MHIVLQFINNCVEKLKLTNIDNGRFLETLDLDKSKSIIVSKKLNNTRIFNPFIIYLMNGNNVVDKKYVSHNNLDVSLYSEIVVFYRRELFNKYVNFKSKKFSYRIYINDEKTSDDHILTITNIVVKKRKKNNWFIPLISNL